jgi:hypothetical protein
MVGQSELHNTALQHLTVARTNGFIGRSGVPSLQALLQPEEQPGEGEETYLAQDLAAKIKSTAPTTGHKAHNRQTAEHQTKTTLYIPSCASISTPVGSTAGEEGGASWVSFSDSQKEGRRENGKERIYNVFSRI